MPSPFRGMDPYLEAHYLWEDVHAALANELRRQLQLQLRPRYIAALTPYVTYEDILIAETSAIKPDIAVLDRGHPPLAGGVQTLSAPHTAVSSDEPPEPAAKAQRIEIRQVGSDTLVTVIEILSPANKNPGSIAHEAYLFKRRDLLRSDVHLLELDLLRRGARWPFQTPLPAAPYYAFLSRAGRRPLVEVWPITFFEPPLLIAVPLRAPDPDVALDLGAALAQVYEQGAFDLRIDYTRPPPAPPLSEAEAARVAEVLRAR